MLDGEIDASTITKKASTPLNLPKQFGHQQPDTVAAKQIFVATTFTNRFQAPKADRRRTARAMPSPRENLRRKNEFPSRLQGHRYADTGVLAFRLRNQIQ